MLQNITLEHCWRDSSTRLGVDTHASRHTWRLDSNIRSGRSNLQGNPSRCRPTRQHSEQHLSVCCISLRCVGLWLCSSSNRELVAIAVMHRSNRISDGTAFSKPLTPPHCHISVNPQSELSKPTALYTVCFPLLRYCELSASGCPVHTVL